MFTYFAKRFASQLIAVICVFLPANVSFALSFEEICVGATAIDSNGSAWSAGYDATQVFNVNVTTAGILVVDVIASGLASPRLIFLGRGCAETGAVEDFVTVEQGAAYQLIAIRAPGTYSLQLVSPGIGLPLGEYELRSSFTPTEIVEEEVGVELWPGRRMLAHQTHFFVDQTSQKSEEETDPNQKSEEETVDPDPNAVWSPESDRKPILTLIVFRTTSIMKSEEETVDPDPNFVGRRPGRGAIAGSLVLYPDGIDIEPGHKAGDSAGLGWLSGLLATR